MRTTTLSALSLWSVDAVVFDLRELRYEWGNTIWGMYGRSFDPSGIVPNFENRIDCREIVSSPITKVN
jgi:hypothetical protein